jgi:hypothetical protein
MNIYTWLIKKRRIPMCAAPASGGNKPLVPDDFEYNVMKGEVERIPAKVANFDRDGIESITTLLTINEFEIKFGRERESRGQTVNVSAEEALTKALYSSMNTIDAKNVLHSLNERISASRRSKTDIEKLPVEEEYRQSLIVKTDKQIAIFEKLIKDIHSIFEIEKPSMTDIKG